MLWSEDNEKVFRELEKQKLKKKKTSQTTKDALKKTSLHNQKYSVCSHTDRSGIKVLRKDVGGVREQSVKKIKSLFSKAVWKDRSEMQNNGIKDFHVV